MENATIIARIDIERHVVDDGDNHHQNNSYKCDDDGGGGGSDDKVVRGGGRNDGENSDTYLSGCGGQNSTIDAPKITKQGTCRILYTMSRCRRRQRGRILISFFVGITMSVVSFWSIPTANNPTMSSNILTTVSENEMSTICNETSVIARQVYNRAIQNDSKHILWHQTTPMIFLSCEHFLRSVQIDRYYDHTYEISHTLSLIRLAKKLQAFERGSLLMEEGEDVLLKIVVIGGSMTTGVVDVGGIRLRDLAWPRKLSDFLQNKWPNRPVEVVNLAQGGANEDTWLGNIDMIVKHAPDVILVESAVNDQCEYDNQAGAADQVNRTSYLLLNSLMSFPSEPAVFSVELFRIAWTNKRNANLHCRGHVKEILDHSLNQTCVYCEQWWMPQDWRTDARDSNSISYISYRDAVWPDQDHPPEKLCQYWSGLSHPQAGVHAMVASTMLFQFILTDHKKDALIKSLHGSEERIIFKAAGADVGVCLNPVSSFHAVQGDPTDPMNLVATDSCWRFQADTKEKYGWICEVGGNSTSHNKNRDFHDLQKLIYIGKLKLVIISRLVSYVERMATAQVWFSAPNSNESSNVFVSDPVWNVTSSHAEKKSTPTPYQIRLDDLKLKGSLGLRWKQGENLALTLNIKLLVGSSESSIRQKMDHVGIDKFKLLGIVSC
jgi:hypothetical protein